MSDKENTTKELTAEVLEIAKQLKAAIKLDKKTGIGEATEGVYEATLPEGLTIKQVKLTKKHDANFHAAGIQAVGELAVDALKSNKDLTAVKVNIPIVFRDSMEVNADREHEHIVRFGENAGEVKKTNAYVTAKIKMASTKNGSGQLKIARDNIAALGAKFLSKQ